MAEPNDPTTEITRAVRKIEARLVHFLDTLLKKLKSLLAPLTGVLKKVLAVAEDIAATVGEKVLDQLVDTGARVLDFLGAFKAAIKAALKLAARILATLRKSVDPVKTVKALKTVLAKFIKAFRRIAGRLIDLYGELEIVETGFRAIASFRLALQKAFRWIGEISGAAAAARKVMTILKKLTKALKLEVKEAVRFGKRAARLATS